MNDNANTVGRLSGFSPWGAVLLVTVVGLWSYWTSLGELIAAWSNQPDYSHGFLVVPLACMFLWLRRDLRPDSVEPDILRGLTVMIASLFVRFMGLRYSFDFMEGYSLILWVSGVVLLLLGRAYFRWSLPSLLFLFFMVPLPFQLESKLSVPLQQVATSLSCFLLQCLRQPAFADGTTILLGPHQLHVEHACSGLRMFVGAFALAFAFLIVTRREIWEQALLLLAVIPISLLANAMRIVSTGLLYQAYGDEAWVRKLSHDLSGLFMIPLAAFMFAIVLWYLSRLVRPVERVGMNELLGRSRT